VLHLDTAFDEAQLATAAFRARYGAEQTLKAYRRDLRMFFQWASDNGVQILKRLGGTTTCTAL
jgi:site-specific recombinase XerD